MPHCASTCTLYSCSRRQVSRKLWPVYETVSCIKYLCDRICYDASAKHYILRNRMLPSLPLSWTGLYFYWLHVVNRSILWNANWCKQVLHTRINIIFKLKGKQIICLKSYFFLPRTKITSEMVKTLIKTGFGNSIIIKHLFPWNWWIIGFQHNLIANDYPPLSLVLCSCNAILMIVYRMYTPLRGEKNVPYCCNIFIILHNQHSTTCWIQTQGNYILRAQWYRAVHYWLTKLCIQINGTWGLFTW